MDDYEWDTIGVTALTDWWNIFAAEPFVPNDQPHAEPCPAILLQRRKNGTETRTVFSDRNGRHVNPMRVGVYVETVPGSQVVNALREARSAMTLEIMQERGFDE